MLLSIQNDNYYLGTIILIILIGLLVVLIFLFIRRVITSIIDGLEIIYTLFSKRPAFVHFYPFIKKLNSNQTNILKQQFTFYNRLDAKHQRYFRHRLASFIDDKSFVGRDGFLITEEVKVLVSATALMLTFGFRDFIIHSVKSIIIYPTEYYSELNKVNHKGEFNASLKAIVLSWNNFIEGYRIENDKLNLGIHEFAHAIHFNSIYQDDINSVIFIDTFTQLRNMFSSNKNFKEKLITSEYLRSYAFTNDFELLAVILETFIETPQEFKRQFPEVYSKVKQMLNFNFSGY
ncbi:zinc-dependent peptidase [Flaviramulus aquimarinus]|uniref:Zinc-dependent peptidase n=1 Tax=Flaviramulus aquimarinus TaxID=1170456 RepID=A0ABP9F2A5_9FLAO